MKHRTLYLWLFWIVATLATGSVLAGVTFLGGDRSAMLIGKTTDAHHQFEVSCDSCHKSKPFQSEAKMKKAMNKACLNCHKTELKISDDSHPIKKFRDPRNADTLKHINAKFCVSCHVEHKPEITRASAVTLPMDYCKACHQDVGKNRPSHEGLKFETCATAGCHNFHDNRALYEDFLVKHGDAPWLKETPVHQAALQLRTRKPGKKVKRLTREDAFAPANYLSNEDIVTEWEASAHAASGVNCTGCHTPKLKRKKAFDMELVAANWNPNPDMTACKSCHRDQLATFREGKHAGRSHPKLAKPRKTPKWAPEWSSALFKDEVLPQSFPVSQARVSMKPAAHDLSAGECSACHAQHNPEPLREAVETCVNCHNDDHTQAYFESPHYALWQKELSGEAAAGTGVSCGDCHMPKIENETNGKLFTTHNQNAYLRPNEKMIRPVCMNCHGLAFAIDALADPSLVAKNFKGQPARHIESVDWAIKRVTEKRNGN